MYLFTLGMFVNTAIFLLLFGEDLKFKLKLKFLHNQAGKTAELLSELARVVAQEKLLLQELTDIFHSMSALEVTKYCCNASSYFAFIFLFLLWCFSI